jgi:type VI secretion system secreted protein Hcp
MHPFAEIHSMAMDMFLKIAGIAGESRDKKHGGEIDVLSWSWGISNSGSAHHGGGAGSGKCNVQDFSFTMYVSKGSPELALFCCSGKHIDEATLTVRKAGENPLEYLIIKFTDLMITSYQTGGAASGDDRLMESVTLNFAKFDVQYTVQTAKGGAGDKCIAAFDIAGNVKA